MHAHGVCRGGGFKADAEEYDLFAGVLDGEIDGVERRIDDAHIAAAALYLEQIAVSAGNAQHVAKRTEDDAGLRGNGQGLVDEFERRDADGAAGAVNHFDTRAGAGRKHLVDSIFDNRVSLAAADFHDLPRARGDLRDLAGQLASDFAVAEFGEVLHWFLAAGLAGLAELDELEFTSPALESFIEQLPSGQLDCGALAARAKASSSPASSSSRTPRARKSASVCSAVSSSILEMAKPT